VRMRISLRWHNRYAVLNRNLFRYWRRESVAKENAFVDPRGRMVVQSVSWVTTETHSDVLIRGVFSAGLTITRQALLRFPTLTDAQKWFHTLTQFAKEEAVVHGHDTGAAGNCSANADDDSSSGDDGEQKKKNGSGVVYSREDNPTPDNSML